MIPRESSRFMRTLYQFCPCRARRDESFFPRDAKMPYGGRRKYGILYTSGTCGDSIAADPVAGKEEKETETKP